VIDRAPVQQKDKGEAIEKPVEVININTPPSNHTFKRLIRQLREARKEVARLKEESLSERIKMKELMDMYSNTLDLEKFQQEEPCLSISNLRTSTGKTEAFSLKIESSRKNCNISRMNWPRGT
jgi:hypothetical protein